jgi:alkaline phosphatase D
MRRESQQIFLDFFRVPKNDPRRQQEGVYSSHIYGPEGQRTQVILLDARYHRSPLEKGYERGEPGEGSRGIYQSTADTATTVLGDTQWAWLEQQLRQPADLRIIGSGVQVIPHQHGWETWGNFPHERQRLFELIKKTQASGVLFISGDRHFSEISRIPTTDSLSPGYPLIDVTSSSLNKPSGNLTAAGTRFANEINDYRVGLSYFDTNSGMIQIDWTQPDPILRLQIRDEKGGVVNQLRLPLSELTPPNPSDR